MLLLQEKSFKEQLVLDLKEFFQINIGSSDHIQTVWEASKAFMRGKLIAYAFKMKKENFGKIQELEKEIKLKENNFKQYEDVLY